MSDREPKRQRRARDPNRREKIARTAIDVISQRGVERLTHRDVAAAADVPVGSTTYYFEGRDDLLEAALEISAQATDKRQRRWAEGIRDREDLPRRLAEFVLDYTGPERPDAVVAYELYMAAIRRPQLRDTAMAWAVLMKELLQPFVDDVTAEAVALTLDGAMMRALMGPRPTLQNLEALFSQVLEGEAD
jgi:DNA-binding transcriptional regulator YbjK